MDIILAWSQTINAWLVFCDPKKLFLFIFQIVYNNRPLFSWITILQPNTTQQIQVFMQMFYPDLWMHTSNNQKIQLL